MQKSLNKRKQIPNLTPIRFLLAFLVILFHVSQFSKNRGFPYFNDFAIFNKGIEAVYMFFSLSGFLIIKQLFNEKKKTQTVNLKSFYLRRILRIFPLYYLILIFGFLYYRVILPNLGFDVENNYDLVTGIILSATFFPNIFLTYSPGGILEILWSIGVEEQFYLLIAPLFLLLPLKRVTLFLLIFTFAFFIFFFSDTGIILKEYNMLFFYFSFSGLCAIIQNKTIVQKLIGKLRLPILLLFVIYFTTSIFHKYLNSVSFNLFSFILFGLTILALSKKPIPLLENKPMNYLGKISYGIYMFHPIALQGVGLIYMKVISKFNFHAMFDIIFINLSILIITLIISHLSYKYYESFFLKLKLKKGIKNMKSD